MYSALMPAYDQPQRGRASGAKDAGGTAAAPGFLTLETGFLTLGTGFRAALAAEVFGRPGVAGRRVERDFVLMLEFCLRRCGFCVLFAAGPARV